MKTGLCLFLLIIFLPGSQFSDHPVETNFNLLLRIHLRQVFNISYLLALPVSSEPVDVRQLTLDHCGSEGELNRQVLLM